MINVLHAYIQSVIMKPIKIIWKKGEGLMRKSNREGKFDLSTLYECMETSNENLLYK
jgi:hypothetical protein